MNFAKLEKAFLRALVFSFFRRRIYLMFPTLVLCGILTVLCRALSVNASAWVAHCLGFLPFFLSFGIMLALGTLLAKMYPRDITGTKINVRRFIGTSMDLFIGVGYIAIPSLLIYLVFWMLLGFFYLLQEIPGIGMFFSVILSFVPFLLVLSSLLLFLANLGILFFVTPAVNLLSVRKGSWIKQMVLFLKEHIFSAMILFGIGIIPMLLVFFLLFISVSFANASFPLASGVLALTMKWFFMMIPFAFLLSPSVLFFFNFSSESYALLKENK